MPETKIVSGKDGTKGSVLKVTLTLLLQSMSDAVTDAMTAKGADLKSFFRSGSSLETSSVTDLWCEHSGYRDTGGGIVMAGSTGYCSYPMSMRI
jgi:hypothetical protein